MIGDNDLGEGSEVGIGGAEAAPSGPALTDKVNAAANNVISTDKC